MTYIPEVTDENHARLLASAGVVLVDYYMDNCGPCKLMDSTIKQLAEEFAGLATIAKANAEVAPAAANFVGATSFPTLALYKNQTVVKVLKGRQPAAKIRLAIQEVLDS